MLALVKLFLIFFIILGLKQIKVKLEYGLLIGSILLGLTFGLSYKTLIFTFLKTIYDWQTIELIIIVLLILVLSNILQETGSIERISLSLKKILKSNLVISAILPALMGLFPMPAGALVSAPMVNSALKNKAISNSKKTFINYWFRHIWEYSWPLYSGVILVSKLASYSLSKWVFHQIFFSFISILIGIIYLFIFRRSYKNNNIEKTQKIESHNNNSILQVLFLNFSPFIIIIFFALILNISIIYSLILGILSGLFLNHIYSKKPILSFLKISLNMIFLIIGIMIFKSTIEKTNIMLIICNNLKQNNIHFLFLISFIPFIVGFFSGVVMAFVGITFPIILSLFNPQGTGIGYVVFAFVSGYIGTLLSPIHLCLLLTKEYFKISFINIYKYLIFPVLVLLLFGLGYCFFITKFSF